MSKTILQVVDSAYRATVEEQDDTVIWFTHAIKAGGADVGVLLRGAAVNYCVAGQDASGLAFGDRKQTQPPDVAGDLTKLIARGVAVHAVETDVTARGLSPGQLIGGVRLVKPSALPDLFEQYDLVWQW
jgi:hypothetical protein